MRKIVFCLVLLVMLCFACQKLIKYKEFTLKQTPYTGNELQIDGYYYHIEQQSNGTNKIIYIYCFYRNSVLLSMGGGAYSFEEADEYIRKNFIEGSRSPNYEYLSWGLFAVVNKNIKFERYYPQEGLIRWTYVREGKILNDTTFHITTIYRSDGTERREENEIYHFRKFSPKPDSTNNFIK